MNRQRNSSEGGFTLIEIAIVVVIIGLLLGGVLKGQEMIRSARSHNVITQSNGLKAAMLGFSDRYRALPGDYSRASVNIPGITANVVNATTGAITTVNQEGNGDSFIGGAVPPALGTNRTVATDATGVDHAEISLVWLHLGNAGYISGGFSGVHTNVVDEVNWNCPSDVCMTNAYNGAMFILNDNKQAGRSATSDSAASHQIWSGNKIPAPVISDIDSKTDDGEPGNGNFRVADRYITVCALNSGGTASVVGVPATATTYEDAAGVVDWAILGGETCGGVYLF
ncbi:MAG: prepilin-type N-terminal cleavage/methylation domain-containing protein [Magnetococcales bacterium]|nr:prepilin-type N-terminal cleavage/methylation domain-containing protein [Magnetococcales bacterium]